MALRTLLVANRGEIACRVIRTARAMGIRTVAVYSDADASALHVEMADDAVALRGVSAADTYLRSDKLLEAAALTGADAVHPGYGFLSENADFARDCSAAGLTFVGPPPEIIAAMGDKLAAKRAMAGAGVPLLPSWPPGEVPDDAYPVIVKAAAGGGGKGMRLVTAPADLAEAVAAAQREAGAAFGDDRVFVEPYLTRPRHVEVQILGDRHGHVVHLGERECSVQRRHQKIIEESPSPAVDVQLRRRLCEAAVAGAKAIGYVNAGTFEFVLGTGGRLAFLEVNTRLQVEHPVTELAWRLRDGTPLDLVRLQLLVAGGQPLPFTQDDVVCARHAVEARVYAEDPAAGFLPATGTLHRWSVPPGVRSDAGVRAGDEVGPAYDPLLAKVIAVAPTRTEAALSLASALAGSRIAGVKTNRSFLVQALRHPAFLAGDYDTGFVDEHLDAGRGGAEEQDAADVLHGVAAALLAAHARRRSAPVLRTIPLGWRNNPSQPQRVTYRTAAGDDLVVEYRRERDGSFATSAGRVTVLAVDDDRADLEVDGRRLRAEVTVAGDEVFVDSSLGHSHLRQLPRFPDASLAAVQGGLIAPMPGAVVSVAVTEGDEVARGTLLLVLEAMKMEHRILAPADGVVAELRVHKGAQVDAGDVLVVIDPREGAGST